MAPTLALDRASSYMPPSDEFRGRWRLGWRGLEHARINREIRLTHAWNERRAQERMHKRVRRTVPAEQLPSSSLVAQMIRSAGTGSLLRRHTISPTATSSQCLDSQWGAFLFILCSDEELNRWFSCDSRLRGRKLSKLIDDIRPLFCCDGDPGRPLGTASPLSNS